MNLRADAATIDIIRHVGADTFFLLENGNLYVTRGDTEQAELIEEDVKRLLNPAENSVFILLHDGRIGMITNSVTIVNVIERITDMLYVRNHIYLILEMSVLEL